MVAWKDQMEDYLIVCDNNDSLQSQKRKKSLIIPAGFHLDLEIQCKESTPGQNDWEKDEIDNFINSSKSFSSISKVDPPQLPTQKHQCPSINLVNTEATDQSCTAKNTIKPFANSSYVDIQRHADYTREVDYSRVKEVKVDNILMLEKRNVPLDSSGYTDIQGRKEDMSEDYSRVKGVTGDNMVLLQKQSASLHTSCREKGNRYAHCTNQKPGNPHVTGPSKVGVCTELIDRGYVDTIPAPPLM